jgi:peptide/nickel transport system permease protein
MAPYLLRRLLAAVPLLIAALVINFTLIHLAPGDPIYLLAGEGGDQKFYAAMRAHYGLDQPIGTQLVLYLANAAQGQLGQSFAYRRSVVEIIMGRLPATLLLVGTSLGLSSLLGIWLGTQAAQRAHSPADHLISLGTLVGYGLPAFWLAQLLVIVFAVWLGWFPVQGMTDVRYGYEGLAFVADVLRHLALPLTTLTLLHLALVTRLTRTGMREQLGEDYVRTAHAKGLTEDQVVTRHALRNALLPVVTTVGGQFGTLLTSAVLTEIIFAWPGLGRLLYDATLARDYPLLMGIFLFVALSVIIANLVTDIAYTFLDPRVRYS